MEKLFGSVHLIHCLKKIGFIQDSQKGSSHLKFIPPKEHKIPDGIRPFMMVQLGKKQYDPHSCSRYLTELNRLGFNKKELEKLLQEKK